MAMSLYIQVTSKEWKPGSVMIPDEYRFLEGQFVRHMAGVMAEELQRVIDEQRYVRKWPPLSVDYYQYKKEKKLSLNIWEATGTLKNNITYWRSNDRWVIGIPRNLNYPNTGVRIYKVAKYMEYGTSKMPARPLFRPLTRYLSRHIRDYWNEFLRQEGY